MNIPMTWHQPGPQTSGFFRHVKENSNPLRKALALSILVGTLLWTAPVPLWLSIALFTTLSSLALGIALIPATWPLWLFEPIPQRDRQAMARTVARDMALQFLEEEGRRQIPPDAVLFYTIRSKRLLVRVVDPTGRLNTPRSELFVSRACPLRSPRTMRSSPIGPGSQRYFAPEAGAPPFTGRDRHDTPQKAWRHG